MQRFVRSAPAVLAVCLLSWAGWSFASAAQGRRGEDPQSNSPPDSQSGDSEPTRRAPRLLEDLAKKYFGIADYSKDGWITYQEAEASLSIDRAAFAVYDLDRDGRIDAQEFRARYEAIVNNNGAFPPPLPKAASSKAPRRSPDELLGVYDKDRDGALDQRELGPVLTDYSVSDLSAEVAIRKLDADGSGKLELLELQPLLSVLSPRIGSARRGPRITSIEELFGRVERRDLKTGSTPQPPQLPGPVSAFRRLDLDNDGKISARDLVELQRPLLLSVRINAVIASLDTDGDGEVSKQEFWSSMGASNP